MKNMIKTFTKGAVDTVKEITVEEILKASTAIIAGAAVGYIGYKVFKVCRKVKETADDCIAEANNVKETIIENTEVVKEEEISSSDTTTEEL